MIHILLHTEYEITIFIEHMQVGSYSSCLSCTYVLLGDASNQVKETKLDRK